MADAEDATIETYMEALLPVSQNVFVLEGDFGSDTDAAQVLAGSSSAQGLGVAPLALPYTDVCTPPRSQSSALFTSPGTASDIASFSGSTSTRSGPQDLLPPRRRLVINWNLKVCGKARHASCGHRLGSKVAELGIGGVCWRTYATGDLAALL